MLPSKQSLEENPLLYPDYEDNRSDQKPDKREKRPYQVIAILVIVLLCLIVSLASGAMFMILERDGAQTQIACEHPPDRREWRDLGEKQKQNYLDAVLCLKETPSRLNMNQSLYDDFPWVHALVGEYCA